MMLALGCTPPTPAPVAPAEVTIDLPSAPTPPVLDAGEIEAAIAFLADDAQQGRPPGTEADARVQTWIIERMQEPKAEGGFEPWTALEPTLLPLLSTQVGALFLPWSDANARAIAQGAETFTCELAGRAWTQKPQKYHARSLAALRARHAAVRERAALDPLLERAGCLAWLRVPA